MQYGFIVDGWDLRTIGDLTEEAEAAGWDGLFISDAMAIGTKDFPDFDFFDPWVGLAVMATRSERIRIGTIITPVPRRRPWKLARETLSIDHLSNGRLILGVGLGAAEHDGGFFKVGEPLDIKVRARLLDEGLAVLTGLWTGKPFSFRGEHYQVNEMTMLPPPVQTPRIPIWVPGVWQKPKSMERALRWDGIIPQKHKSMSRMSAPEIRELKRFVDEHRQPGTPFDIIAGGETSGSNRAGAVKKVRPFMKAGATWWLESKWTFSSDELRARIKQGPPRD
jgi:alkanesulfonate monooxygenase SsuD/methylene tetrahydromethanopterin reductase-like flavin-dependent oxidoreductase (luciferase family)